MKNIITLVTEISQSHTRKMLSGIWRCCRENDCNLILCTCERRFDINDPHDNGEYMIYQVPDFSDFDGAIIINSTIFDVSTLMNVSSRIKAAGIPASSLERTIPGFLNFAVDNRVSMKSMTEHLIHEHGFRRINFVTGLVSTYEADERLLGYKQALEEAGIPFEKERVFYGNYLSGSGEAAARTFLSSPLPLPQAIACSNDIMAFGVCQVLHDKGIRVPQDIAVTGFDDDYESQYHIPSMTSVVRNQEEQGYEACLALLNGTASKRAGEAVSINTEPVYRESCGCSAPRADDNDESFKLKYFSLKNMEDKFNMLTRSMAIALTSVESFMQLKQVIRDFIPSMDCDAFPLFLYNDVLESVSSGEDDSGENQYAPFDGSAPCTMIFSYDHGIFSEDEPCDLHTILKNYSRNNESVGCVLSPIHFGKRFFGYSIICNSRFSRQSKLYYSWTMNIGNAIENIRKQRLLRVMISKLNGMWCRDSLTELYNRIGFKKFGGRIWDESIRNSKNIMLLFIDMDGLKNINDTFGHDEGDRCIRALSGILKAARHHSEAIMRYGGDEFVIIGSDVTEDFADSYIAKIQNDIENYNSKSKAPYRLGASIGKYIFMPTESDTLDGAIDLADQQMYEIKKERKK